MYLAYNLRRKMLPVILAMVIVAMSVLSPSMVRANPVLIAAGGIEIGALVAWGGAALVATTLYAVGLDDDMAAQVDQWGKDVWAGANDVIKTSISASVQVMKDSYNETEKYVLRWSPEVLSYLTGKWVAAFGGTKTSVNAQGYVIPGVTGTLFPFSWIPNYFTNQAAYKMLIGQYNSAGELVFMNFYAHQFPLDLAVAQSSGFGNYDVWSLQAAPKPVQDYHTQWVTYPCTSCQPGASGWSTLGNFYGYAGDNVALSIRKNDTGLTYKLLWTNYDIMLGNGAIFWRSSANEMEFPYAFPASIAIPAPRGDVVGGELQLEKPKIGRIGATVGAGIAVGYVTNVGDLAESDSVTDTTTPPDPGNGYDPPTGSIDWRPLLTLGDLFTTKFPFSIPWDVARQLSVFNVAPTAPSFAIDTSFDLYGKAIPIKFGFDLSAFDVIATFLRWGLTIAFDIAVILAIRKLLPE